MNKYQTRSHLKPTTKLSFGSKLFTEEVVFVSGSETSQHYKFTNLNSMTT